MGDDTINPFFGISKELNVQFCLGYDPMEFNESLRAIAEGDIDVTPMITGEVPLEGLADAFEALGNPDIARAHGRERVCQAVYVWWVGESLTQKLKDIKRR